MYNNLEHVIPIVSVVGSMRVKFYKGMPKKCKDGNGSLTYYYRENTWNAQGRKEPYRNCVTNY